MYPLVSGALVGLALAAPVGPVGVLCIRTALTQGRWPAVAVGLGAAIADGIFGAVAGLGLVLVQTFISDHQAALGAASGVILILLGAVTLSAKISDKAPPASLANLTRNLAITFSLAITNPATMVAAFGLIAALDPLSSDSGIAASTLLVVGVFLGSTGWWLLLASVAVFLRQHLIKNLGWINRISGGLFLLLGVTLITRLLTGQT